MTKLYIKASDQGLQYFGKTIQNPHKYKGSGRYWTAHLKKHNPEVQTIVIGEYEDNDPMLIEHALGFSAANDIVLSDDWANLKVEDGLTGGRYIPTQNQKEKNRLWLKTEEGKESREQARQSTLDLYASTEGQEILRLRGSEMTKKYNTEEGIARRKAFSEDRIEFYKTEEGIEANRKKAESHRQYNKTEAGKESMFSRCESLKEFNRSTEGIACLEKRIQKMKNTLAIPTYQIDPETGVTLGVFQNTSAAAFLMGYKGNDMICRAKKTGEIRKGFLWK